MVCNQTNGVYEWSGNETRAEDGQPSTRNAATAARANRSRTTRRGSQAAKHPSPRPPTPIRKRGQLRPISEIEPHRTSAPGEFGRGCRLRRDEDEAAAAAGMTTVRAMGCARGAANSSSRDAEGRVREAKGNARVYSSVAGRYKLCQCTCRTEDYSYTRRINHRIFLYSYLKESNNGGASASGSAVVDANFRLL